MVMPTMRAASTPSRSVIIRAWSMSDYENEFQFQFQLGFYHLHRQSQQIEIPCQRHKIRGKGWNSSISIGSRGCFDHPWAAASPLTDLGHVLHPHLYVCQGIGKSSIFVGGTRLRQSLHHLPEL